MASWWCTNGRDDAMSSGFCSCTAGDPGDDHEQEEERHSPPSREVPSAMR